MSSDILNKKKNMDKDNSKNKNSYKITRHIQLKFCAPGQS